MTNYPQVRLGDVCESVSITHKLKQDKIILVNTSDVFDGKVTNHNYVENKNLRGQFKKRFKRNDILYSEIRPKNKRFAFVDFEAMDYVASTKLMAIRAYDNILPIFLFQILKNDNLLDRLQVLAETRSGTFPQITFSEIRNIEIPLPSLPIQRTIAATLSCLDDKIELNNRINANLEAQAQAIFKSWFVDFEPFQGGEFVESEFGKIPKGWKAGALSDIGKIVGGSSLSPSKGKVEYFAIAGTDIAWITPKDLSINKDKYISHGETDITKAGYENSSASLMPKDSILFSSRAPIGYIAIAKNEVCTNQGFKSIVPKAEIGTEYTILLLKTKPCRYRKLGIRFYFQGNFRLCNENYKACYT